MSEHIEVARGGIWNAAGDELFTTVRAACADCGGAATTLATSGHSEVTGDLLARSDVFRSVSYVEYACEAHYAKISGRMADEHGSASNVYWIDSLALTVSDHRREGGLFERAVKIIEKANGFDGTSGMAIDAARALHEAGMLAEVRDVE